MAAQSMTDQDSKMVCKKCMTASLRRRTPSFLNQITSLYPYTCGRCGNHQKKFRFTVLTLLPVILVGAIAGGLVWFHRNESSFLTGLTGAAPQDQSDALARARTTVGGELSPFEQMMLRKPKASMDNATIMKLQKAGVGRDVILQMIRTSNADYDVSANAIIELKEAGVDQAIILAMINSSYSPH